MRSQGQGRPHGLTRCGWECVVSTEPTECRRRVRCPTTPQPLTAPGPSSTTTDTCRVPVGTTIASFAQYGHAEPAAERDGRAVGMRGESRCPAKHESTALHACGLLLRQCCCNRKQ